MNPTPTRRAEVWAALQQETEPFDVVIIGGGASGTGVALETARRGWRTLLIERDDLSSGTSSRSTKLIHGGVRYLEKAVKNLDRGQFNLVRDALRERATLIRNAPHLAAPLALVTPLYRLWQIPYLWVGLKLYDALAGRNNLAPARYVNAKEALRRFPMLKPEGLRGAVIYYDGQFDDARMNVAIAQTAAQHGAWILTHATAQRLDAPQDGLRTLEIYSDASRETGVAPLRVQARVVVNAAGPFLDEVRRLEDPSTGPMLSVSSGVHIILDARFSPPDTGMLIPETEDGRVLFLLPWQGMTLVGTTDQPAPLEAHPRVTEEEIEYILRHVRSTFALPVARNDVRAAWSGLRPLVSDPNAVDTAKLSRDHVVHTSPLGMVTIAGGKWTTYRRMAIDTANAAAKVAGLPSQSGDTEKLPLLGGDGWTPELANELTAQGAPADVAQHLCHTYGVQAQALVARDGGRFARVLPQLPYLQSEVAYLATHEWVDGAVDLLARRWRLAMLDANAAREALEVVLPLLADTLGWDAARVSRERQAALAWIS